MVRTNSLLVVFALSTVCRLTAAHWTSSKYTLHEPSRFLYSEVHRGNNARGLRQAQSGPSYGQPSATCPPCTCPVTPGTSLPPAGNLPGTLPPSTKLAQCNTKTSSGVKSDVDQFYKVPVTNKNTVTLEFEAFDIPDRFRVAVDGRTLYDSGFQGSEPCTVNRQPVPANNPVGPGSGSSGPIALPGGTTEVVVVVSSPCDGTRWEYTLSCV